MELTGVTYSILMPNSIIVVINEASQNLFNLNWSQIIVTKALCSAAKVPIPRTKSMKKNKTEKSFSVFKN